MFTARRFLVGSLPLTVVLCSCGRAPEPPSRYARTLGDSAYGAPVAAAHSDMGILGDQTAYKSASPAARGAAGGPGGSAIATADVSTAARELVNNLLNDLQSGEIALVLNAFVEEQVALIREDDQFLWNTQEAYGRLTNALGDAFGDSSVEQLNADLRDLVTGQLSIDPIDANVATVTPNPLIAIFGPKATPAMTVARQGNEWKIRLEEPLTADDVAAIKQYQQRLQNALDSLGDALAAGEIESREAVYAALLRAAQGADVAGPDEEAEGDKEESPDESEVSPEEGEFDPSRLPPPRPVGP